MSGNQVAIVMIHPRRTARLRDGRHRRLTMEQLERRWLLSGAAGSSGWPAAAVATTSAAKWPEAAPATAASATALPAATTTRPAAPIATSWPAASPAAVTAISLPAVDSSADCDSQGGWADVDTSGSDNSGSGAASQGDSTSSPWSASGANQLPAKKPGLLVLSPEQLGANAAGEGGLVDLTRMSNQNSVALLAAAPSSGGAAGNDGSGMGIQAISGADGSTDSQLPAVSLEGLRGTSQAFDVAVSPASSSANGATLDDASAELRFRPATVWPMPMLPHLRSESGSLPATSTLPDASIAPGDGKTTFAPAQPHSTTLFGSGAALANARRLTDGSPSSHVAASESDAKKLHGTAHDSVFAHLADFVHDLSVAARLNDRRVEAAVVAVALAAMPYRRFRKRQDAPL